MFEKKNIKIIAGILVYALIMVGIFTPFSIFEKGEAQKDEIDMAIELIRSAIASALDDIDGWLPIDNGSYPLTNLVDLSRTIPIISRILISIGILGILVGFIPILILIAMDSLLTAIYLPIFLIPIISFFIGVPVLLVKFLILKPIIILNIPLVGLGLVCLGLLGLGLGIWGVSALAEFLLEILEPMLSTRFPTDFLTTIGA